jgi:hypothetical protein
VLIFGKSIGLSRATWLAAGFARRLGVFTLRGEALACGELWQRPIQSPRRWRGWIEPGRWLLALSMRAFTARVLAVRRVQTGVPFRMEMETDLAKLDLLETDLVELHLAGVNWLKRRRPKNSGAKDEITVPKRCFAEVWRSPSPMAPS